MMIAVISPHRTPSAAAPASAWHAQPSTWQRWRRGQGQGLLWVAPPALQAEAETHRPAPPVHHPLIVCADACDPRSPAIPPAHLALALNHGHPVHAVGQVGERERQLGAAIAHQRQQRGHLRAAEGA